MKKISKTIAMVLVLIMLAGSFNFTSCLSIATGNDDGSMMVWDFILSILIIGLIGMAIGAEAPAESEARIYPANATDDPFSEYYSLRDKMYALPEMASFMERLNALSETKRSSLTDKLFYLPETEFAASAERLNALSEEELASVMRAFSSLSETEFDSLMEKLDERLNSSPIPQNVAMDNGLKALPEMSIVSSGDGLEHFWGNSFTLLPAFGRVTTKGLLGGFL
ncbi:MAG: hypothetical protein LBI28_02770 [Treponema sp.]|jgi:hypothetical protein|nr:hypothetical protein [Treponema sp.]